MVRYLFEEHSLPVGFKLPTSYCEFLSQSVLPDLEPWWFLAEDKNLSIDWAAMLRRLYPDRQLLPFAKRVDNDDVACFDTSDFTGNPKVFYVHAFASPGWEHRGELASFDDWLSQTQFESEKFKAEMG